MATYKHVKKQKGATVTKQEKKHKESCEEAESGRDKQAKKQKEATVTKRVKKQKQRREEAERDCLLKCWATIADCRGMGEGAERQSIHSRRPINRTGQEQNDGKWPFTMAF